MTTYYLRFPDRSTFLSLAQTIGAIIETEDGPELQAYNHSWSLDCIGIITKTDSEGKLIETIPGYHVNAIFIKSFPEEFEPYIVNPSTPSRVFA